MASEASGEVAETASDLELIAFVGFTTLHDLRMWLSSSTSQTPPGTYINGFLPREVGSDNGWILKAFPICCDQAVSVLKRETDPDDRLVDKQPVLCYQSEPTQDLVQLLVIWR